MYEVKSHGMWLFDTPSNSFCTPSDSNECMHKVSVSSTSVVQLGSPDAKCPVVLQREVKIVSTFINSLGETAIRVKNRQGQGQNKTVETI